MPTYHYLIQDIAEEAGDSVKKVRIPELIRGVERELWALLSFLWQESIEPISIPAEQYSVTVDTTDWMMIKKAYTEKGEVERVPEWKLEFMRSASNGNGYVNYFSVDKIKVSNSTVKVHYAPYEDTILNLVVKKRESELTDEDDETTKWFLGEGYYLIKYGVLSKRVFNPDKWPAWKQEFDRIIRDIRIMANKEKKTYRSCDRRFF